MALEVGWSTDSVETILRRRGITALRAGSEWDVLLVNEDDHFDANRVYHSFEQWQRFRAEKNLPAVREAFHYYLEKRSFRLVLRRLMERRSPQSVVELANSLSVSVVIVEEYVRFLRLMKCIEGDDEALIWSGPAVRFSDIVEQHLSWLASTSLRGHGSWGVQLSRLPRAGGDIDTLAWLSPSLVAIEVKCKQPANVETDEMRHFLQRHIEIAPDLSILLVDDHRALEPIIKALDRILYEALLTPKGITRNVVGSDGGVLRYSFFESTEYPGLWITHTLPVVVASVRDGFLPHIDHGLQHYYSRWKGSRLSPPPGINFIPRPADS